MPADTGSSLNAQGIASNSVQAKIGCYISGLSQTAKDSNFSPAELRRSLSTQFAADGDFSGTTPVTVTDKNGNVSQVSPTLVSTNLQAGITNFIGNPNNTAGYPSAAIPIVKTDPTATGSFIISQVAPMMKTNTYSAFIYIKPTSLDYSGNVNFTLKDIITDQDQPFSITDAAAVNKNAGYTFTANDTEAGTKGFRMSVNAEGIYTLKVFDTFEPTIFATTTIKVDDDYEFDQSGVVAVVDAWNPPYDPPYLSGPTSGTVGPCEGPFSLALGRNAAVAEDFNLALISPANGIKFFSSPACTTSSPNTEITVTSSSVGAPSTQFFYIQASEAGSFTYKATSPKGGVYSKSITFTAPADNGGGGGGGSGPSGMVYIAEPVGAKNDCIALKADFGANAANMSSGTFNVLGMSENNHTLNFYSAADCTGSTVSTVAYTGGQQYSSIIYTKFIDDDNYMIKFGIPNVVEVQSRLITVAASGITLSDGGGGGGGGDGGGTPPGMVYLPEPVGNKNDCIPVKADFDANAANVTSGTFNLSNMSMNNHNLTFYSASDCTGAVTTVSHTGGQRYSSVVYTKFTDDDTYMIVFTIPNAMEIKSKMIDVSDSGITLSEEGGGDGGGDGGGITFIIPGSLPAVGGCSDLVTIDLTSIGGVPAEDFPSGLVMNLIYDASTPANQNNDSIRFYAAGDTTCTTPIPSVTAAVGATSAQVRFKASVADDFMVGVSITGAGDNGGDAMFGSDPFSISQ